MHSSLRIQDHDYIFDTVALQTAFETIAIQDIPYEPDYSDEAVYALFDYFCDWSAVRSANITTSASETLDDLSRSDRQTRFTHCCARLAENLSEQYSIEASQDDIVCLARLLGEGSPDLGQYDFILQYVCQYATHLYEMNPYKNDSTDDIQELVNETRNLPADFRQAKEQQYTDGTVNRIRGRLLEKFHTDGEIEVEVLEDIKNSLVDDDDRGLAAWSNYTIVAQIYYDYHKPRLQKYLQTLADRMVSEFSDLSLTTHLVDFQGARNFVSDFAWIAVYPERNEAQTESYQLYLGIRGDSVRYGLHVGDDLRTDEWKRDRDLNTVEQDHRITMDDILTKLRAVEPDFRRLEDLGPGNSLPEVEEPVRSDEILRQLETKKQVVFYGPPGTGKTHIATTFAEWWVNEETEEKPDPMQVQSVTFHPAFSYEDFLEGLQADATDGGAVTYEIEDGILKRVARQAKKAKDTADGDPPPYVLIIDEINRGNLAQIFGETITLLEADKRDSQTTRLAHSDDEFSIPSNLYVIGTMNTADRSIALVDAALRRRFRFLHFPPDYSVLFEEHSFKDWAAVDTAITESSDSFRTLLALSIRALQHINQKIVDAPDLSKGQQIGHSYFYEVESTQDVVDAWRFDILPLLEEYYFGQFDRIKRQLFDGAGDAVIDWTAERIRDFTEEDLVEFLGQLFDGDVSYTSTQSTTDGGSVSTSGQTPTYPSLLGAIHQEVINRVGDMLEVTSPDEANYNPDLDRTTLAIQSAHPAHPSGDTLRYALQPKIHLDDPRIRIGVYATEEFRSATDVDFAEILSGSAIEDRFECHDKTYATVQADVPVDIDADNVGSLDEQERRETIGEQTLQDIIDTYVTLIETVHPAIVEADTPTQ